MGMADSNPAKPSMVEKIFLFLALALIAYFVIFNIYMVIKFIPIWIGVIKDIMGVLIKFLESMG